MLYSRALDYASVLGVIPRHCECGSIIVRMESPRVDLCDARGTSAAWSTSGRDLYPSRQYCDRVPV